MENKLMYVKDKDDVGWLLCLDNVIGFVPTPDKKHTMILLINGKSLESSQAINVLFPQYPLNTLEVK